MKGIDRDVIIYDLKNRLFGLISGGGLNLKKFLYSNESLTKLSGQLDFGGALP